MGPREGKRATQGLILRMHTILSKQNLGEIKQISGHKKLAEDVRNEFSPKRSGVAFVVSVVLGQGLTCCVAQAALKLPVQLLLFVPPLPNPRVYRCFSATPTGCGTGMEPKALHATKPSTKCATSLALCQQILCGEINLWNRIEVPFVQRHECFQCH